MALALDFAAATVLGFLVGLAELVSRYRDAPKAALYTRPAVLYILLNGGASAAALALIHAFNLTFGATTSESSLRETRVLVAGIGAMALFRTSLFTVRAGDRDIGVGPATFLQIFREAADREVDRLRAQSRSQSVGDLMVNIDYTKASDGLVPYCLALMQNVSEDEQQKLLKAVQLLDCEPIADSIKVRILGLHLVDVVGPDVLAAAVESLQPELKTTAYKQEAAGTV